MKKQNNPGSSLNNMPSNPSIKRDALKRASEFKHIAFWKKPMFYINSVARDFKAGSKFYSFLLLLSCFTLTACEPDIHISNEPLKIYDISSPRFKVYKTENVWNLLLLDTRTGRLWQAQYSTENDNERLVTPISTEVLANGQNGRFTLTPTENMWTFILTDSVDGRLWQCQFSTKKEEQLCIPIDLNTKEL